jgi:hypothetical protein
MHLELIRDEARVFPDVPEPLTITSAKVWHCRYVSLAPLGSILNLRRLEIATYPDPSLDPLTPPRLLEELHILHMPGIRELSPLASLENLRVLTLQTTPGWDPSGKAPTSSRSLLSRRFPGWRSLSFMASFLAVAPQLICSRAAHFDECVCRSSAEAKRRRSPLGSRAADRSVPARSPSTRC